MRNLTAATVLIFAAVLTPVSAMTQEREPAERQALIDLAYVLGEMHALRQACDPGSQRWRQRMQDVVETEAGDHNFSERMRAGFNNGFLYRQQQFPSCSPQSRQTESAVARRGQALSIRMAQPRS